MNGNIRKNIRRSFKGRLFGLGTAACVAMASLSGCGDSQDVIKDTPEQVQDVQDVESGSAAVVEKSQVVQKTAENAAAENLLAVETMFTDRDASGEYQESKSVQIALIDGTARCDSPAVTVSGGTVTIRQEGVYLLSGTLDEGMIVVEADEAAKVQLVLKGASVSNSSGAAIYVRSADKVFVTLAEGTVSRLANGGSYTAIDDNNIDGVIFSKCDLTVNGKGSLEISAEAGHGIVSKDDLKIMSGSLAIEAAGHGLSGKDSVRVAGGTVSITSGKDGIQADHEKEEKGYVYIAAGTLTIIAAGDGISASGLMQVDGGSVVITAGNGSANRTVTKDAGGNVVSTKGIKAEGLIINNGSFVIDSQDDALHAGGSLTVNGGEYQIATGDDGVHGEETVTVAGGSLVIAKSYEGIEGKNVIISGGYVDLYATDDGINAAGGNDQSGFGGMFGGKGGGFGGSGNNSLVISGGTVYVNAAGDGLDANGTLTVSGGTIYVDGPTNSANGALDYDGKGEITGGTIIALGAAGMAQNFTEASNQGSILLNTGNRQAGTEVALRDESGKVLCSYTSRKAFACVVVSCPGLEQGGVYTLSVGGDDTKITMDSLIYGNGSGGFGGGRGGMGDFGGGRDNREDWGDRQNMQDMPEGGFPDKGNKGGFQNGGNMGELPEGGIPDRKSMKELPGGSVTDKGGMQGTYADPRARDSI